MYSACIKTHESVVTRFYMWVVYCSSSSSGVQYSAVPVRLHQHHPRRHLNHDLVFPVLYSGTAAVRYISLSKHYATDRLSLLRYRVIHMKALEILIYSCTVRCASKIFFRYHIQYLGNTGTSISKMKELVPETSRKIPAVVF
jgi:hypothetical protein